jgi:HK97 family phage portal protein
MNLFGFELSVRRRKASVSPLGVADIPSLGGRGWSPLIREPYAGAWQRNQPIMVADVFQHATAWSCITLIAGDIAKLRLKLIAEDNDGIWNEVDNPAYSPVLRRPNHYQNRIQFFQSWMISKLTRGNTYVLKERDARGVVVALYVLEPSRVQVLVSPDGQVYYQCAMDPLVGIDTVVVPATEMIHDVYLAPYHPLCGVPPILACGMAIGHSQQILQNATTFFQNGSQPGGVLTAPGQISDANAKRVQEWWEKNFAGGDNVGKVAVLSDGLKYERMGLSAVEADVIKQLEWDDQRVCSTYHVPAYMVGVGAPQLNSNVEALQLQYYQQCLQNPLESIELLIDEGLSLNAQTTVEFDVECGLLRMDSATKMKVATDGVRGGIYSPNEGRAMHNLKPMTGGDTIYLQEQDHSLQALFNRDSGPDPFGKATKPSPVPAPVSAAAPEPAKVFPDLLLKAFSDSLDLAEAA